MVTAKNDTPAPRALSLLSTTVGALALGAALAADALGVGSRGLGPRQLALAAFGAVALATGVWLSGRGRAWVTRTWDAAPRATPIQCLGLAVWCGLVAGLVEVAHQGARCYVFGVVLRQPDHFVWMVPVSCAVLFGALGLGFAAVARLRAGVITVPVVVFACALVAGWSQFLIHPWIDTGAAILVSAAVAAQITRTAATSGLLRFARRTFPWLASIVLAGGLAVPAARGLAEMRAIADRPEAAAGAPNVLLIVLDTVRADHMGLHGYARDTTPTIDVLAEQSAAFRFAFSTAPWTLTAHASMFTGHYPHVLPASFRVPLDEDPPTLAEVLSARGYATGGFVGNVSYCERGWGIARGFAHYEDFYVEPAVLIHSSALGASLVPGNPRLRFERWIRNDAATVNRQFLSWLDEQGERPFFAFLNYFDAHAIYLPPKGFDTKFDPLGTVIEELPHARARSAADIQTLANAYDGCLRYIDFEIGQLFAALDNRGRMDNTIVIVTSDHGEQFGEHGLLDHANSLYRSTLHVPLVIRPPGGLARANRPGRLLDDIVSLRDLPATILDLVGLGGEGLLPGQSLAPLWREPGGSTRPSPAKAEVRDGPATPRGVPTAKGDMKSLIANGLHLILNGDGSEELYLLDADIRSEENVIGSTSGAAAASRMREQLK